MTYSETVVFVAQNIEYILENECSFTNPLQSSRIEKTFDVSGAIVRLAINYIINEKQKLVGSDETGYWIARTPEQAEMAISQIYSREIKLNQRRRQLEKLKEKLFGCPGGQQELFV